MLAGTYKVHVFPDVITAFQQVSLGAVGSE